MTLSLVLLALVNFSDAESDTHGHSRKPIPPPEELAKLPADGGKGYNRLVFEKSPYLLQHAGNPVDWWPWGDAAFAEAKKQETRDRRAARAVEMILEGKSR